MNKVIHAHTLMDFMQANPNISTIPEIKVEFEKDFGDVRFTNCTNQIYTFEEILEFLSQRNKILYHPNGVKVNEEHRCDH